MADRFIHSTSELDEGMDPQQGEPDVQGAFSSSARSVLILSAHSRLPDCRRLIVLVPNIELAQDGRLPQRVWQLASPGKVQVVYLAVARDYGSEMAARRRLTLLAAITRDKRVPVEIHIAHTTSWLAALRPFTRPGDMILSHAGQWVRKGFFGSEPLCDQLGRRLSVPVYLLSGYVQEEGRQSPRILRLLGSGALLGLILAGFFALDAQVIQQLRGSFQQVMLLTLFLIEVGAIWAWNGLIG